MKNENKPYQTKSIIKKISKKEIKKGFLGINWKTFCASLKKITLYDCLFLFFFFVASLRWIKGIFYRPSYSWYNSVCSYKRKFFWSILFRCEGEFLTDYFINVPPVYLHTITLSGWQKPVNMINQKKHVRMISTNKLSRTYSEQIYKPS